MHLVWLERLGVFKGVLYPDGAQRVCSKDICLKQHQNGQYQRPLLTNLCLDVLNVTKTTDR